MEKKSYDINITTEHDHQTTLFDWIRINRNLDPRLKAFFAVPNQRKWTIPQFKYFEKEGFKSGVSDVLGLVPQGQYHGIVIEMKRKGGKPTPEQIEFLNMCRDNGYKTYICFSAEEAIIAIQYYLSLERK